MKNGTVKHHMIGFRTRQRGASLLEGIAYLGIAAIVILGAVSLLSNAFGNAQANRAMEEIISLRTSVRKLFTGQAYPADALSALNSVKAIPGTLTVDGTTTVTVKNSWGGTVTVGKASTATDNSFTITYPGVPKSECINILSGANGWTSVAVGTNSYGPAAQPLKTSDATTACSGDTNTLTFTST